jgi:hypothetical protein
VAATRPKQLFDLAKAKLAELGISGLTVEYGPDALMEHGSPPRIVWCKGTGDILPTDRVGGNPRPLVRRRVRVEAHIWGQDDEQAEQLLEENIRVVHALAGGVWRPVSELWPQHKEPEKNHLGATGLGVHGVVTFEADLYVDDTPTTTAHVTQTAFDTSTSSPTDGQLDAGEPAL